MANWITLKQLSEKRGIAESDLRTWANLGYIASSRIENVLMIDDESLTQYLDVHQTKDLGENYLEKIIKEKELEREVLLSQCDDELFLLKTQKLHHPHSGTRSVDYGRSRTGNIPFRLQWRTHRTGGET